MSRLDNILERPGRKENQIDAMEKKNVHDGRKTETMKPGHLSQSNCPGGPLSTNARKCHHISWYIAAKLKLRKIFMSG